MRLKMAIEEYLTEKADLNNLSANTVKYYRFTLTEFELFCTREGITNVKEIRQPLIKAYLRYCSKERGNQANSLNSKLVHLKIFFNWLIEEGLTTENPTGKIKKAKVDKKIELLSKEELKQVLRYVRRQKVKTTAFHASRDYALLVFIMGTGVRIGECEGLRWKDINLGQQPSVSVFGKARKSRTIPLVQRLVDELASWKAYQESFFQGPCEYVFPEANCNKPASVNALKLVFKRIKSKLDLQDFHPHMLRHQFAHDYLTSGGDVVSLSKILGHGSIKTTQIYADLFIDEVRLINERVNPLNWIDMI